MYAKFIYYHPIYLYINDQENIEWTEYTVSKQRHSGTTNVFSIVSHLQGNRVD